MLSDVDRLCFECVLEVCDENHPGCLYKQARARQNPAPRELTYQGQLTIANRILDAVRESPKSISELAHRFNLGMKVIYNSTSYLCRQGKLVKVGRYQSAIYVLPE